jgi:hypothetical protein
MATATITKKAGEKFAVGFLYKAPDLEDGEVITTCTTSATSGLTLNGSPVILGAVVSQMISGGTAGTIYVVTFTTTTSAGSIYIDTYSVTVEA